MIDLSKIPITAISAETKQIISTKLNAPKVLRAENGLPRDWKGFIYAFKLSTELIPFIATKPDPCEYILNDLAKKCKHLTLQNICQALEMFDREDVINDAGSSFDKDAIQFNYFDEKFGKPCSVVNEETDKQILTVGDLHSLSKGLKEQHYDAFLLYADEDAKYAADTLEQLENNYNLKLCVRDRDLVGGINFEHEAIMTLISERCNRLMIIITPNFLKSEENQFFLNYAQALGIEKRQRKIVPCVFERCQLPNQLKFMYVLDYNKKELYDFWGKLRDSISIVSDDKSVITPKYLKKITTKLPIKSETCNMIPDHSPKECNEHILNENKSNQVENFNKCNGTNAGELNSASSNILNNSSSKNLIKSLSSYTQKKNKLLKWTKKKKNSKNSV